MEIYVNALIGRVGLNTIRIVGMIKKHKVTILIYSGSTHSFIDHNVAHSTSCSVDPTAYMLVGIANGDKTFSQGICSELVWTMQGHSFTHPICLLKLRGCDMVLGTNWLKKHSIQFFQTDNDISMERQSYHSPR